MAASKRRREQRSDACHLAKCTVSLEADAHGQIAS